MAIIEASEANLHFDPKAYKILVVDDNATNLAVIVDFLEEQSFTTLISKDGESCLKRAQYAQPDIILLDILMPGIDGYETCRRLKTNPQTVNIPVIFMTALSRTQDKVLGFEAGAVDYVTKPIQPQEVFARIKLHLRLCSLTTNLTQRNQLLKTEVDRRQQVEQQLQTLNEDLELKVEQRTLELKKINQDLQREVQERQKEVFERQKAEKQVRKSLQEKETLLKEIHHRVKNNLLVVASLLDLQSSCTEDDKTIKILEHSQDRIYSMALVHEQLYKFHDLKCLNLANYIVDLVDKLSASHDTGDRAIKFLLNVSDVVVNIETARPCGLMINELIVNSLEHAFPDDGSNHGTIQIDLAETEGQVVLSVTDDGVGLAEDFDPEESDSLGLQLVYTLTEQLDGELKIDRDRAKGTSFQITFSELQKS